MAVPVMGTVNGPNFRLHSTRLGCSGVFRFYLYMVGLSPARRLSQAVQHGHISEHKESRRTGARLKLFHKWPDTSRQSVYTTLWYQHSSQPERNSCQYYLQRRQLEYSSHLEQVGLVHELQEIFAEDSDQQEIFADKVFFASRLEDQVINSQTEL
ncbi:hypothetical protein B0H10DRAFT_1958075 [Mycena sp. CBHHK59/15]|nr:hypothetical protein B0H10DRAFT_1958075 [Mycena sp. CBHHK59/15]